MSTRTFPLRFHFPEGRVLRGPVPLHFERFYRSALRFHSGSRLATLDVATRYRGWALAADAPALSLRDLARAMANIGHGKRHSNGMFFADVALAEDLSTLADNYPAPAVPASTAPILDRLDQLAAEVAAIRAYVTPSNERTPSHA